MIQIYVMTDERGCIRSYASPGFKLGEGAILAAYDGELGEGLELLEEHGVPVYKLAEGMVTERTQAEIDADIAAIPPPPPSQAERIEELEDELVAAKILLGLEV